MSLCISDLNIVSKPTNLISQLRRVKVLRPYRCPKHDVVIKIQELVTQALQATSQKNNNNAMCNCTHRYPMYVTLYGRRRESGQVRCIGEQLGMSYDFEARRIKVEPIGNLPVCDQVYL